MSEEADADPRVATAHWPYTAGLPQRYSSEYNYGRYLDRGGLVRPAEDVQGFVAGTPGNRGDMARFYFFCLMFDQLEKEGIAGDVAELGVYKGNSAALLAGFARRTGRTAWLLDTFAGFSAADLTGIDAQQKMQFADTSVEAVRELVGEDRVRFVKGRFPDSATQLPQDARYALVHIDCDLYAPMAAALDYFYPRLVPGGFLVMHDYSSLHWDGAEHAVDKFFASHPESPLPLPDGGGSVAIRKSKPADPFANWLVQKRAALLAGGWTPTANGALMELLGAGWSVPEKWGVWGIGPEHELNLYLPGAPTGDIRIRADVNAVLVGSRTDLQVDVEVAGALLATWVFTRARNNEVRSVTIPLPVALAACREQQPPAIRVAFRPRSVVSPLALDPAAADDRELGLGLIALLVERA